MLGRSERIGTDTGTVTPESPIAAKILWQRPHAARITAQSLPSPSASTPFHAGRPKRAPAGDNMRVQVLQRAIHIVQSGGSNPSTRFCRPPRACSSRPNAEVHGCDRAFEPFDTLSQTPQSAFEPPETGGSRLRSHVRTLRHAMRIMPVGPSSARTRIRGVFSGAFACGARDRGTRSRGYPQLLSRRASRVDVSTASSASARTTRSWRRDNPLSQRHTTPKPVQE